jgi:hypothetical protein
LGCGSPTLEDYREEGQSVLRSIIHDLHTIKTKQDLVNAVPKLNQQFNRLVDIMLEAEHLRTPETPVKNDFYVSDELRTELLRIYQLPDGRELIEQCQAGALIRLEKGLR